MNRRETEAGIVAVVPDAANRICAAGSHEAAVGVCVLGTVTRQCPLVSADTNADAGDRAWCG